MYKFATLITCAMLVCANVSAAGPLRHETVVLAHDAPLKKLAGKIQGDATAEYSLTVPAGAALDLRLNSANRSTYFNVYAEGADQALFVGSRDGDHFHATATGAGGYRVQVYLMRNAARRNETARYVLAADIGAGVAGKR